MVRARWEVRPPGRQGGRAVPRWADGWACLLAVAAAIAGCLPEEEAGIDCAGLPGGNAAPTVDIVQPGEAATFEPGEAIHFAIRAEDDLDGPADLVLTFEDSVDGPLDMPGDLDEAGQVQFDWDGLSTGVHALVVTVTDRGGCTGTDDRAIQVCAGEDCL